MRAKELYEKYAGWTINDASTNRRGVVCGYTQQGDSYSYIIWAIDAGQTCGWKMEKEYTCVTHQNNPNGYYAVMETHIDHCLLLPPPIANPLDSSIAEGYINEHFKTLDDDTRDIYINIFMAGYEFKQLEK